jgi:hypothetical protein
VARCLWVRGAGQTSHARLVAASVARHVSGSGSLPGIGPGGEFTSLDRMMRFKAAVAEDDEPDVRDFEGILQ